MRVVAIEEHFITPLYREKVSANEFRNFYLDARGRQMGHDIVEQNLDLGEKRLAHMDAHGVDMQVLSFGSPGPQAFPADVAIPMARDANEKMFAAVKEHPRRFAAFAALPTADPRAAADELERCVNELGFKGAMIHSHQQGEFRCSRSAPTASSSPSTGPTSRTRPAWTSSASSRSATPTRRRSRT